MDITIHASFLPHDDPDASLAFHRNTLGFEVQPDPLPGAAPIRLAIAPEVKRLELVRPTEVLRNG